MRRIMVATDFSTRSDRALRRAVLMAHAGAAELFLVHVVDDDQPRHLIETQSRAALRLLNQTSNTLASVDDAQCRTIVTTGDAFDGILRTASELKPDLIVLGPHRRQFLDTFVGTTAERTIQRSGYPILMANAVPSRPHGRVLLAIDVDDASQNAVKTADSLGLLSGADLVALHLFDAPAAGMMRRAMETSDAIDHYVSQEEKRARAEFLTFLTDNGLPPARLRMDPHQTSAGASIRNCADEEAADLIVLGTNQRVGLERFFLGSVAQAVLLDAMQDVLVVPLAHAR